MKKQTLTVLAMASLFVMLAVVPVSAGSFKLRADIPFDFMAGNETLPAGTYTVTHPDGQHGVLLIRSWEEGAAFVLTNALEANGTQDETKLIFNRYGDRYFLTQLWTGGEIGGHELPKSRMERELARESMARNGSEPEMVSIAAL